LHNANSTGNKTFLPPAILVAKTKTSIEIKKSLEKKGSFLDLEEVFEKSEARN